MKFIQLPLSVMQNRLPGYRKALQLGSLAVLCTNQGSPLFFLLQSDLVRHLDDVEGGFQDIGQTSFNEFCCALPDDPLVTDFDCLYLTYKTRIIIAVVSPEFQAHLPLPVIGQKEVV